ncbi:MAG: NRDE family protein, partial [Rhodanobacter sp.]
MCLILLAWQAHPDYPLVLAANRDEFYARPSAPAAFLEKSPQVLAGQDLAAGGSWLGVNRQGCFAALTNYREGGKPRPDAPSRGRLVADFLAGSEDAGRYLDRLASNSAAFNAFNLFVGDGQRLGYYSNRGDNADAACWLTPGIYGLSNHLLDTPWPKLATAKAAFAKALAGLPQQAPFFELLA